MNGWGEVIAIAAQERLFYALAGNIAINNCFNARAVHAAVAAKVGVMKIPMPDYLRSGSFRSLELRKRDRTEFIGQPIDYSDDKAAMIRSLTLDSLELARIDLIKIDIEGMEIDAIEGAVGLLARAHPVLIVESIKSDKAKLREILETLGYRLFYIGLNPVAIHESHKTATP